MSKPSGKLLPYNGFGPATQFVASLTGNADQDRKSGLLTPETQSSRLNFQKLLYNVIGSRSIKPDFNSTLPYDEITFFDQGAGGDFIFAIEPAPGKEVLANNKTGYRTRASERFLEQVSLPGGQATSRFSISTYPWQNAAGILVDLVEDSNDLILPYGTGGSYQDDTVVDRGINYINARNGQDVVIGGYGEDIIGSSGNIKDLKKYDGINATFRKQVRGSKFYVGGSGKDVLAGGLEADFLIGDRLNGYELYLPTSRLNGIPDTWKNHLEAIKSYQPSTFSSGKGFDLTGSDSKGFLGTNTPYPLWIPGNDIIRGYEGDDIIHGDDNTISENLFQLPTIKKWLSNTPKEVVAAGGINDVKWNEKGFQLGADFIDGGTGNDQIFAGIGADAIIGGYGSDVIDTGPQIVTSGYNPFFGPKVIFGGNAILRDTVTGEWVNDTSETSPDLFVIGALIDREAELSSSNSGELDTASAERRTMAEKLAGFETVWKQAQGVVKAIPKVGGVIVGVVNAVTSFLKKTDPKPVSAGKQATAIDTLTIIRDFDKNDILSINAPNGSRITFDPPQIFGDSGADLKNPLAKGLEALPARRGLYLSIEKSAGDSYKRVFLDDVTELAVLGRVPDPGGSGTTTWTFGGSNFLGALDLNGNPYSSPF